MRLKGKTAIITGTAGGIGRASARLFVQEGAQVALFDIDEAGMNETARLIGDPENYLTLTTDISSESNVARSVAQVIRRFGKIDILFSNAALNRNFKPALETTDADWDAEHNVTLKGAFRCCRHVVPHMLERKSGSIIFTASYMAFVALPGMTAYCTAKGGLLQLARSLACDYSPKGIRVNVVAPGPIDTPVFDTVRDRADLIEAIIKKTLLGRMGKPEEVAKVALFLASDDASYMTGSVVTVDGGSLACLD
jgi:NAD(P)-dependent dehydrogenase (short-subunit alcohol dehydrogenase family)